MDKKTTYILLKLVDDEWWEHGTYHDVCALTMAAFELGQNNYDAIKVEVIQE